MIAYGHYRSLFFFCLKLSPRVTYRYIAAHFFHGVIRGSLHDDIAEQRLNANRAGIVLHGHLVDVQRLEGGNAQLLQSVDQVRPEVVERAPNADIDLRVRPAAGQHVDGYIDAEIWEIN